MTRDERVQHYARIIREFEDARLVWDNLRHITFTVCLHGAPDEVAEAKRIAASPRATRRKEPSHANH